MLICKNVVVNGRRTSMRLDRETWISIADICDREGISMHTLCSKIDGARGKSGLSSATRLFVLSYFRNKLNQYEQPTFHVPPEYNPDILLARAS